MIAAVEIREDGGEGERGEIERKKMRVGGVNSDDHYRRKGRWRERKKWASA